MTPAQAVKTCLTEKYATFTGRAPRSEYWWFFLAYIVGMLVLGFLPIIGLIYWLATIVPLTAVGFRRMQDIGKPGWYFLIPAAYSLVTQLLGFGGEIALDPETGMPLEMPGMGSIAANGLVGLIGLVIVIVFLWFLTRPSEPGPNAYGPPPAEATT